VESQIFQYLDQHLIGEFQFRGIPDQVIYVWFDALLNYATAVGLTDDDQILRVERSLHKHGQLMFT